MALPIGLTSTDAVISSGGSLSPAVALGARVIHGILMPTGWDAAALTFQASVDGTTFFDIYSSAGTELSYTVAASRYIPIDPTLWRAINLIKVRSGTSGAAVNQTADRTISLILKPLV